MDRTDRTDRIEITGIRHAWPEGAGFELERPRGHEDYTFLHFFDSVEVLSGGERIVTRPHACILYAPGTPQWFHSTQPLLHDWFHFKGKAPTGLLPCNVLLYPSDSGFITAFVQEMEAEYAAGRFQGQLLLDIKVKELFIRLARACAGDYTPAIAAAVQEQFHDLRRQVITHLGETWTVERMAETVHLSQSRFFNLYHTLYGKSPVEDLISTRIDAARTALAFGDQPIALIAGQLGYNNLSHFMRQFHARTGETPAGYRRRHRIK